MTHTQMTPQKMFELYGLNPYADSSLRWQRTLNAELLLEMKQSDVIQHDRERLIARVYD